MRLADLIGTLTYVDANVVIHAVEGYVVFADVLAGFMDMVEGGELTVVTSELTLSEVLVKPIRHRDRTTAGVYQAMLSAGGAIEPVAVTRPILVRAAEIRASVGGKLPDAIHAATAQVLGCDRLITSDLKLKAPPDLPVVLLQDVTL